MSARDYSLIEAYREAVKTGVLFACQAQENHVLLRETISRIDKDMLLWEEPQGEFLDEIEETCEWGIYLTVIGWVALQVAYLILFLT